TYAGNPLAIAASHAVIDIIKKENLLDRSQMLGDNLQAHLKRIAQNSPQIAEVRGLGSMVAVEFNNPATKKPDPDYTKRVQAKALEQGLILLTCGVYANVIRFLYPLTIDEKHFDEALDIIEKSIRTA
ncbi:MAG: aminotransferase class III-fold pyridoxal phosphate-dependent enzyme, partial [Burkholderiales bacterium]